VIGVDRALCGLEKHVVVNGKTCLVSERPGCDWVGASKEYADPHCLRTLFELESKEFSVDPPQRYATMATSLGKSDPWELVHPTRRLWWAQDTAKRAERLAAACSRSYQRDVFAPCTAIFERLQPWRVDARVKDSDDANAVSCLTDDGWLHPPTYNRFGTRTGRLTVTEGPRVLTVRHDTRALFRAVDDDHEMLQFDFAALEARCALGLAGRHIDLKDDPYAVIAELMGAKDRDEAKSATFSALYSDPTAKTQKDPRVSKVRRIFKLGETFTSLKRAWQEDGVVRNMYGRVIPDPIEETLYNNYVQSTGADVVMLGFNELEPRLRELGVVVHFLLHDALFASVPKMNVGQASKLAAEGVSVQGFKLLFPIKASRADGRPIV
jgi:hypothetical protein